MDHHHNAIVIKGAREHNLKNIDLTIPRNQLVVITGLSGSGKSSLAFDTIFAEGQRRYVESLSSYARQFLEQMDKPEVDSIDGLSPAISIDQKSTSRNPRSTVGTITEIYDYLRVLFARVGRPYCYVCGKAISGQSVQQITDLLMGLPAGSKLNILAPIIRGRKGEYQREFEQLRKDGFVRIKIDGAVHDLAEDIALEKNIKHYIDVFIDRLVVKDTAQSRIADSIETALKVGKGLVKVEHLRDDGSFTEQLYSEHFACIDCGISYPEISPRMFSFNNPHGACADCGGLGVKRYFDENLLVADPGLSLLNGAIIPLEKHLSLPVMQSLHALAKHYGFNLLKPFGTLTREQRAVILHGSGDIELDLPSGEGKKTIKAPFVGILALLEQRYREIDSEFSREELEAYMRLKTCPSCNGARLKKESLHIKLMEKNIFDLTGLSIQDLSAFFRMLNLSPKEHHIAERLLREITARLRFLEDVGLTYLSLQRSAATLSGGEAQRIRLATQIGSSLVGVLYILDEPSIGLHQRDNVRLINTLVRLRDLGNTVLVVEHDKDTMLASDFIVDMGPGAGVHGGEVIVAGTRETVMACEASVTGKYLSGEMDIAIPDEPRKASRGYVEVIGASGNNLKNVDCRIPIGLITCVTGVSGSGKSTLINDTVATYFQKKVNGASEEPMPFAAIHGDNAFDKVIVIDQSPIGRTPRSNPATYTGLFNDIRDLFTELPESKMRGYKPGRYSFNVKGGRCEACGGDGQIKIEMHFLPDMYVKCDVCNGQRYNRETLEIKYKGKHIADVLAMSVEDAFGFMENIPKINAKLQTLLDVGLSYIQLGQAATTLSGGEAQRIKLSKELTKRATGKTIYLLDEPTTGLHFEDIRKLLEVLHRLADAGNTVVIIEHNLDVIKNADYVIDLGPDGGDKGGEIVATGSPRELAAHPTSHTGSFLRQVFEEYEQHKARRAG